MDRPERLFKTFIVALAAAVVLALPSGVATDESALSASNPFNRPLDLLPDATVVEAYRIMGYEQTRNCQKSASKLFIDSMSEAGSPSFAYIASQAVRNAELLKTALNNPSLLRLYETLLGNRGMMRAYQEMAGDFARYRHWLYEKGSPPPKMEHMLKADIARARVLGLRPWSGPAIEALADYYLLLREDSLALARLEESLTCDIEGGNISAASHLAGRIGYFHLEKGDLGTSERYVLQSLRSAETSGDVYYISRALTFLAQLRATQGRFAEAESLAVRSVELGRKTRDPRVEFSRMASLAELEVSLGECRAAEVLVERAMALAEMSRAEPSTSGNVFFQNFIAHYVAQCLMLRGAIRLSEGDYPAAIAMMEKALGTSRGPIDRNFEAALKKKLGDAYAEAGRAREAMTSYGEALSAARKLHAKSKEAECLNAIGAWHLKNADYRRAERTLEDATMVEEHGSPIERIRSLDLLARAETALGRYAAARRLLERSIAQLEREIDRARSIADRRALQGLIRDTFADLIALEGEHFYRCDTLIATAEKARVLRYGETGLEHLGIDARIRRCLTDRDWIPENGVVIEYVLASDGIVAAAMDRYGETYRLIPIAPDALESEVDAFVETCMSEHGSAEPGAPLRENDAIRSESRALYDLLLLPLAAVVSSKEVLCFIPDEPLGRLPFTALMPSGGDFLIETKRIVMSPNLISASSRSRNAGRAASPFSSPLIVGFPETSTRLAARYPCLTALPEVEREISHIAHLLGHCTILSGPRATKESVLASLPSADCIHIATHRISYPASSGQSALLLSSSGAKDEPLESSLITEKEVRGLDLSRARLVVLSACESAACGRDAQCQALGFAGAFLEAGAQSVVAAVWPIEDREAERFASAFYRELVVGGRTPRQAMWIVQNRIIEANRLTDREAEAIRFWAPYVVVSPL
jgi:CHAT domain-containing protein/tetratricopeptide (TPR) repeat protein